MFARHRQLLATGVFGMDALLVAGAWLASYWLRFFGLGLAAPRGLPSFGFYTWVGAVLTPVALLVFRALGLYRSARTASLGRELLLLLQGVISVTALAALGSFFARGELARSVLLVFAVLTTGILWTSRVLLRLALRALRRRGRNLRHVAIVGTGELALGFARTIERQPDAGLAVRGFVAVHPGDVGESLEGYPVLGTVADLPGIVERPGVDFVYLALPRAEYEAEKLALDRLLDSTVAVRLVPDLAHVYTLNATVEDFAGTPVLLITESPAQGWNAVFKRAFDLVLSAVGLVVLAPLLLLLAIWVRLDSPGPAIYGQERVGLNGRRFRMYKFRTMRRDAEAGGQPGWTIPGDPRRTGAGGLLRRLSLDELPQLWNVLLGHMSLVGPRPERPAYVERFRGSIPRYMLRHHVRSGMTGWAQVNGLRGDTPLDRRIEHDLYYIQHWSFGFDVKILLLTFVRVFRDASAH